METAMRQTWAFLFRGYHITRRYIGWVIVFNFYALVTSATVALIGGAANDYQMTLTLVVGALLWNYLSWLYNEIAMSIAYERWEGTLEYTFMAPVSRGVHLLGVSLYSLLNSIVTSVTTPAGTSQRPARTGPVELESASRTSSGDGSGTPPRVGRVSSTLSGAAMADPAEAERATGYVVGGISPIGGRRMLTTALDDSALGFDSIYVSGGRRGLQLELAPGDLARATDALVAPIARG